MTTAHDDDSTPERVVALKRIRFLMEFWGITIDEIETAPQEPTSPVPAPTQLAGPKYRHPSNGETWDGFGEQPDWLKRALLLEGYTVEQLRVAAEAD
ncbi:H-NS histone family protein [Caldimonas sp. KR1-144]|uniref:H-NS histone family protein n=1 Tax=Caldimonas sp. KR1-144 TaxID=3400911 RepID=UPI003BFE1247